MAAGCGAAAPDTHDRVRVVTTIGMITDLAARIGGDRVEVDGLMGPGVDPHLYKASAGDVRRLARADLVLYNGLHLEAAMGEVLEEMGKRKLTFAVTDSIDRRELTAPPEFKGSYDPHVWFDVRLWQAAARAISRALQRADPAHAAEYAQRGDEVLRDLEALDEWVRARVAEVPEERRVLVTAHDAFNYFGRAYGFEVKGLQGISTASEAGTADVQRLAAEIARRRIPAIFVETSIPRRTIEAVQAAVRSRGFDVSIGGALYSDALGNPGTPEGTYVGMVRHNVNTIVGALGRPDGGELQTP
ncbi:MAG TPA: zinc ABC transporter substrate-binding protein [Longimicrobiales bacterium]|nr:zinc ABC transporter substrate-binding protein [Longimicrobiales bacterium]